jgi:hypothetical protein
LEKKNKIGCIRPYGAAMYRKDGDGTCPPRKWQEYATDNLIGVEKTSNFTRNVESMFYIGG